MEYAIEISYLRKRTSVLSLLRRIFYQLHVTMHL